MIKNLKKFIKKLKIDKKNKYLYRTGWEEGIGQPSVQFFDSSSTTTSNMGSAGERDVQEMDKRIEKKPAEVFKEILSEEPKMNLINLDGQITLVKKRMDVMKYHLGMNCPDEEEAMKFLESRKKYLKNKSRFQWTTTTLDLINSLCSKYKVRCVDFQPYYKNAPMEAIDELEKFLNAYERIRKDKPVLKLIIDEGGKETKKDPILLASSPFGKWYYVLGAWDKEVEIVDDLIYNGK